MKKEIKFIGTDNGIICTGRIYLSNVEAAKVEHNKNMLQNTAKDLSVQLNCGTEMCEMNLIIGLSPSIKDLDKAAEVMKDVVDNIAKVIKDMPDLPAVNVEEFQPSKGSQLLAKCIDELCNKFNEIIKNGKIYIILNDYETHCIATGGDLPINEAEAILKFLK